MIEVIVNVNTATEEGRLISQRMAAGEGVQVFFNIAPLPFQGESEKLLPMEEERITQLLIEHGLNERQCMIVILDFRGCSRRDIAAELHITDRTVKWHWGCIYEVLGVENRSQVRDLVRSLR